MRVSMMARFASAVCVAAVLPLAAKAQNTLPPTAPTSVSDLPSARPGASSVAQPSGTGRITWNGSTLAIDAGGDSLRSILLKVKQETGMKVTGGIPDERVFGKYGPAPVQQVLAQLFDGLSVNVLLLNDSPTRPKELVLTARTGGVTPPMASPIRSDEGNNGSGEHVNRTAPGIPGMRNVEAPQSQQAPIQQADQPNTPAQNGPPNGPNATVPASTTPDANGASSDTNGSRTPEQIFEELRRRQQQGSGTAQ